MAGRFHFSIRWLLPRLAVVVCVLAAVRCFGPMDTAEGAFIGSLAGALLGLAIGILKHGTAVGRFADNAKYGTFIGGMVGAWVLQFRTESLVLTIIASSAVATMIAAGIATVRRV